MTDPVFERRFTPDYREATTLRDGSPVLFRLLRPEDKRLLADGLARMSPETRFRRFFSHRDHLTAAELAYLTEIDHEQHFALAAGRPAGDGDATASLAATRGDAAPARSTSSSEPSPDVELGLGVARFVVLPCDAERPDTRIAEAAIAVVDDAQGKGLGRMLFERLVLAAAERGIGIFRFDVLADNDSMLGLVKSLFPDATSHVDEGIMTIDCPIPDLGAQRPGERPEGALYRVLKLAAEGVLRILRGTRERDAMSAVLKSGARDERDLAELIVLSDEDVPGP